MNHNQKGFSLVEILAAILVAGLIVVAGWLVYDRHQGRVRGQQSKSSTSTETALPSDWKTVTDKGLAISYPKAWDETQQEYQRLKIDGKVSDNVVSLGFGVPYGYRYRAGHWEYVDANGAKVSDQQPQAAPSMVSGADSSILVTGGDGGCGGRKLGFVYKGAVYVISLPWECDATTGSPGISGAVVTKDLAQVIKSISVTSPF